MEIRTLVNNPTLPFQVDLMDLRSGDSARENRSKIQNQSRTCCSQQAQNSALYLIQRCAKVFLLQITTMDRLSVTTFGIEVSAIQNANFQKVMINLFQIQRLKEAKSTYRIYWKSTGTVLIQMVRILPIRR